MLAESEAGVWQCAHGGYPNRSQVYATYRGLARRNSRQKRLPPAPVAPFAGINRPAPHPRRIDRIVILITAFLFAQMSK